MKKLFSVLTAIVLSIQMIPAVSLNSAAESDTPPKKFFTVSPSELTMTEGETCELSVTVDPEYADEATVYLYPSNSKTLVSADGTVTAYSCGEESIYVSVRFPSDGDTAFVQDQSVKIHIQPDETLPAETRSELDRLQAQSPIGDFQRKTLELLGILDADAPRITAEQVDEILHSDLALPEMIAEINAIHGYPDFIWRGDPGDCSYWLDEKGNDILTITGETWFFHTKLYDDGTIKEVSALYPPDLDFETVTGPTDGADRTYIIYNQIPYDNINPVQGDANHDGVFNMADIVALIKILLTVPNSRFINWNWETADFNQDEKLNVIDLTLMKRELLCK